MIVGVADVQMVVVDDAARRDGRDPTEQMRRARGSPWPLVLVRFVNASTIWAIWFGIVAAWRPWRGGNERLGTPLLELGEDGLHGDHCDGEPDR